MKVDHKIVTISNLQKAKVQYCHFLISDWFETTTVLLIVKDKKNDQSKQEHQYVLMTQSPYLKLQTSFQYSMNLDKNFLKGDRAEILTE